MNDTELYRQILGINSPWYVSSVELKLEEESIYVHLSYEAGARMVCPECSAACDVYDHRRKRTWRHLDSCQLKTYITASLPRVTCKEHGIHTVRVAWSEPNSRFTMLFERFAIDILQATRVQSKSAHILRLNPGQIHDLMYRAVSRGLSRRSEDEEIQHLTIDEKSYKHGHHYATVLGDPSKQRVIDIVQKRTQESTEKLIDSALSDSQRQQVQSVTIDMWEAFMNAIKAKLPHADIVHDRFHIAKYLNKAVDDTRRDEHRQKLKQKDDTLSRTKYLWLTSIKRMTQKQRLIFDKLQLLELDTAKAWALKESFREFFTCQTVSQAHTFFNTWYQAAVMLNNKYLAKVAQMLIKHIDGLLAYIKHKVTNASAEGLNSLIQQVNSNAKGYRQFHNFRIAILFFLGKLDLYPYTSP